MPTSLQSLSELVERIDRALVEARKAIEESEWLRAKSSELRLRLQADRDRRK